MVTSRSWLLAALLGMVALVVAACGDDDGDDTPVPSGTPGVLSVTSRAFEDGERIPDELTCEGDDISPPLSWSGEPDGTTVFAVIVDDPDAPGGTFVHWVLFNVPGDMDSVPQGASGSGILPAALHEGTNDFDFHGWRGPCPPEGDDPHTYRFRVFALDEALRVDAGSRIDRVEEAMEGHVIASGRLTGTYSR